MIPPDTTGDDARRRDVVDVQVDQVGDGDDSFIVRRMGRVHIVERKDGRHDLDVRQPDIKALVQPRGGRVEDAPDDDDSDDA